MPKPRFALPRRPLTDAPFDDPELARIYEDWYRTPYGRAAEAVRYEALDALLGPLPEGARVLDIGCATGRNSLHLVERGLRPVGVDPAAALLPSALARVPAVRADGRALPFADGSFDAGLVTFVLEFLDDPERLLAEARRVCRGRVAVIAQCRPSYLSWRRRVSAWRGHTLFRHLKRRTLGDWTEIARAAGAEPVEVRRMMFLPPWLAGCLPGLERRMSRGRLPLGGMVGFALPGSAREGSGG